MGRSGLITDAHFRYIAKRTQGDDAFLKRLKLAARKAGIPPIWISPEQASFMQILLRASKVRHVVEVGTLAGYSAICMARALPKSGHVWTIELKDRCADFAEQWIARSDVSEQIKVLRGDARDVLQRMPGESADAAFLDADKKGYPAYLKECLRIVRPGGLIMADNAFAFGELFARRPKDPETRDVRRFNNIVARERKLQGVIVPLGDGLWVAVKDR